MSSSDGCENLASSLTSVTSLDSLRRRRRPPSLNSEQREIESGSKYVSSDGSLVHRRDSASTQATDTTTCLSRVHIHSDISVMTSQPSVSHNEPLAEEELVERLKEVINEFMTRPGRQQSYDAKMRWTIDHGKEINYSVVIFINQQADFN